MIMLVVNVRRMAGRESALTKGRTGIDGIPGFESIADVKAAKAGMPSSRGWAGSPADFASSLGLRWKMMAMSTPPVSEANCSIREKVVGVFSEVVLDGVITTTRD